MLTADFKQLFQASFARTVEGRVEHFYTVFYAHFMAVSPQIKETFKNTNMHRQREMLHESLLSMVAFSQTFRLSRYLEKVVKAHGATGLNLPTGFFEYWLDALIKTVAEEDPQFNASVELAWRTTLSPGITLMLNYDRLLGGG